MSLPTSALIVDDEPHVRTFLRVLLQQLGIGTFWEAGDGQAGLALARECKPGLVLLDINLPVLSGLEVLRELQPLETGMPVIMVSSQSSIKTVQEAIDLGAVGFVAKHAPKAEALATLREALESLDQPADDAQ